MGAASSQPEQQQPSQLLHVDPSASILTSTPITFSSTVLRGLEEGTESDRTRKLDTEYKTHARRTEELERTLSKLTSDVSSTLDTLTTHSSSPTTAEPQAAEQQEAGGFWSHLRSPFYHDFSNSESSSSQSASTGHNRSYHSVMDEVEQLKQKLEGRKGIQKPSSEVEKARDGLVQCLRVNDRRPLDCWQEKEAFERAVRGMERGFVERAGR